MYVYIQLMISGEARRWEWPKDFRCSAHAEEGGGRQTGPYPARLVVHRPPKGGIRKGGIRPESQSVKSHVSNTFESL